MQKSIVYGALCAVVGAGIGVYVAATAEGVGYGAFFLYSTLAAFLTGAFFWWLLVERTGRLTTARAIAVGVLSGVLAHWLCWYLFLVWANVDFWLLGGVGSSLGEAPMNPLVGLVGVLAFCIWSWMFFGPVTVLGGVLLALAWRRRLAA